MKGTHRPFSSLLRSVGPVLAALTLAILFPLSAFAQHTTVPTTHKPVPCLQAPANLDVSKLSTVQLMSYGLPLRPLNAHAYAYWLQTANRIKKDHHVCHSRLATGSEAHHPSRVHIPDSESDANNFAGNYAIQPSGSYVTSSADWKLPCMNTSIRSAEASQWVGLGGFVTVGWLVQAGTDEIVNSSGKVSYTAFVESTKVSDYIYTLPLSNAKCGDQVYGEADSNVNSDGYDYYIIDTASLDYSDQWYWPTSDGSSGECLVENPQLSYQDLADFNTVSFTNCEINSTPMNQLPHNYFNMVNKKTGHELAATGSMSGNGNYNITWKAPI